MPTSSPTTTLSRRTTATTATTTTTRATKGLFWFLVVSEIATLCRGFHHPSITRRRTTRCYSKTAGTFFNPVPENNDDDDETDILPVDDFDVSMEELLRRRKKPSKASQPSTINGVPTQKARQGFGAAATGSSNTNTKKPFVAVGPTANDITNPERDDQGYTLYHDEVTGETSRVFEALVEYPCRFTLKIVGANEGSFVQEMVGVVAEACAVTVDDVPYSTRNMGKWTSVTVQAPVASAEMLYNLYEQVDRDPRVRFKF